jgi:tetratricopeptide (TPR) repeat protein
LLDHDGLLAIHRAAVEAGLASQRDALFAGLPSEFVATLPATDGSGSTGGLLLRDLSALDRCGALPGGMVPVRVWLKNALVLVGPRAEAEVFREALHRIEHGPGCSIVSVDRLPATALEVFGRSGELERLDDLWSRRAARVVSIIAWAGVGKSALVNAWLRRLDRGDARVRPEVVFTWSFYDQGTRDPQESADLFFAQALRDLGDREPDSPRNRGQRLASLVAPRRALLVLDGLEPLQHGAGVDEGKLRDLELRDLLRTLARRSEGLCLVTSRYPVSDLGYPPSLETPRIDLDHLAPGDGATLLRQLGVQGPDAELEAASQEMGGHCLTLTLLGTYLESTVGGDIRRRHELGPFEGDVAQKVRRVMEHYERWFADRPELDVLHGLGLFDRPANEEMVRDLLSRDGQALALRDRSWNQALFSLRKARLVSPEGDRGRGTIDAHALVRDHFGERFRLTRPDAFRDAHEWLYDRYREGCAEPQPATIEGLEPLYAAVRHGCLAGLHVRVLEEVYWPRILRVNPRDPAGSPSRFHTTYVLGAFGLELAAVSRFFDGGWSSVVPGMSPETQAFLLLHAGFCLRARGQVEEATAPMKRALALQVEASLWDRASTTAGALSGTYLSRGALSEALRYGERSVEYADLAGSSLPRAYCRTVVGNVLHQMGRTPEAERPFLEAEQLTEPGRAPSLLDALMCVRLCDLLLARGRREEVLARVEPLVAWTVGRNDMLASGMLLLCRARALAGRGSAPREHPLSAAKGVADEAVDWLSRSGIADALPPGLIVRAGILREMGCLDEARADVSRAIELAERDGLQLHLADGHLEVARLLLATGDAAGARACTAAAKEIVSRAGYSRRAAELSELERAIESEQGVGRSAPDPAEGKPATS